MNAGQLNRRVSLQMPSASVDGIGQPVAGWSEVTKVWADIRHERGLQALQAGADTSVVRASIRIRYRTGVTPAMRVVHGDTVYQIDAVLPDESRREYVDLVCKVVR